MRIECGAHGIYTGNIHTRIESCMICHIEDDWVCRKSTQSDVCLIVLSMLRGETYFRNYSTACVAATVYVYSNAYILAYHRYESTAHHYNKTTHNHKLSSTIYVQALLQHAQCVQYVCAVCVCYRCIVCYMQSTATIVPVAVAATSSRTCTNKYTKVESRPTEDWLELTLISIKCYGCTNGRYFFLLMFLFLAWTYSNKLCVYLLCWLTEKR